MALISSRHKFIFFHTAKTGGSSIKQALGPFCNEETDNLHTIAVEWRDKNPEVFAAFFKFCFVRNPWDWNVSQYEFAKQYHRHGAHEDVKNLTFHEFLLYQIRPPHKVFQHVVGYDKDRNCLMDFIGRYENLEEDFKKVCKMIGIECKLPHVNATKHRHYREYYTLQEDMDIIEYHYKDDIQLFGYTF